jgi:uncharacterized protein YdeI (BOF family)
MMSKVRFLFHCMLLSCIGLNSNTMAKTAADDADADASISQNQVEKKAVVGMIHVVTALDIHQSTTNQFKNKKVLLSGYMVQGLGKAAYLFKDASGTISVYLPHNLLSLAQSAMDTKSRVMIYGHIDTSTFPYTVDAIDLKLKR